MSDSSDDAANGTIPFSTPDREPESPNHRSELRLRLSKQLNLTKVADGVKRAHENGDASLDVNSTGQLEPLLTVTQVPLMNGMDGDVTFTSRKYNAAGPGNWKNLYASIFQEQLGREEYAKAVDTQRKLFKKSCQEGSMIKDVGIYLKEEKVRTLIGLRSLRLRLRNNQGIGLVGYAVMEDNDLVSHDPFFEPGRVVEVTAVHSNYPFSDDDDTICMRTLGLKFSVHPSTSPMDLMLHTGNMSPAFSADAVQEYASNMANEESRKKYLLSLPAYLEAYIEGARSAPSSYYHQHYYSHVTYDVKREDGVTVPCRFRVVPADGSAESGRLSPSEQREAWNVYRADHGKRPRDYLKQELRERLGKAPLEYLLQIVDSQIQCPNEKEAHLCHMHYNSAIPWTNVFHHWRTVATIRLDSPLHDDATELVRYNISNLPSCIFLPDVMSHDDFNLVPHILSDACDAVDRIIPVNPPPDRPVTDDDIEYIFCIETSLRPDAGDDTNVTICIIGSDGRTAFRKMHQEWHDDFRKGKKRTYILYDRPVGEIMCLKLYCNGEKNASPADSWMVEKVVVATPYNDKCYTFRGPIWVPPRKIVTLREGRAILPQMEFVSSLKHERELELQAARDLYKWRRVQSQDRFFGFPGHLDAGENTTQIPKELLWEGFNVTEADWVNHNKNYASLVKKLKRQLSDYLYYKKSMVLEPYIGLVVDLVDTHPNLYQSMKHWASDEEFGRLLLNGSNPVMLRRIARLPADFHIKPSDLDAYVKEGTFKSQLEGGRVYMTSYPALRPLESFEGNEREKQLCVPTVILYVSSEQNCLLPLIIKMNYGENSDLSSEIYTPSDDVGNPSPWLLAKMWARCAEVHYHLLDSYLLKTVFMTEAVAISMLRNLSHVHPVYKLLMPHIRHAPALGTLWRKVLLPEDGAFSKVLSAGENIDDMIGILRRMTSIASYSQFDLPEQMSSKGVIDTNTLPQYFYRDDGLRIFEVMRHYCAQVLDQYYCDDEDVTSDEEMQNFVLDLRTNGMPSDHEFPLMFSTKKELLKFTSSVLFQSTAQASALTNSVVDDMSFVLLSPPALRQLRLSDGPPGDETKPDNFYELQQTLPSPYIGAHNLAMLKLLSKTHAKKLAKFDDTSFTESNPINAQKIFRKNLKEVGEIIEQRNENLHLPYTALHPSAISNTLKA